MRKVGSNLILGFSNISGTDISRSKQVVADHWKTQSDNPLHSTNHDSIFAGAWWKGKVCSLDLDLTLKSEKNYAWMEKLNQFDQDKFASKSAYHVWTVYIASACIELFTLYTVYEKAFKSKPTSTGIWWGGDQSQGLAMVSWCCGRGQMSYCWHMVADRDRGQHDLSFTRSVAIETRLCNSSFLWCAGKKS